MAQPVFPSIEQQTEEWRMKPAAVLTDLQSTGAAVFRWQRSSTDSYHFERTEPREHVLHQRDACAHAIACRCWRPAGVGWADSQWSGAIAAAQPIRELGHS